MTNTGSTGSLPDTENNATQPVEEKPAAWYIITAEETNEILMSLALIERTAQGPVRDHARMIAGIIENVERRMA